MQSYRQWEAVRERLLLEIGSVATCMVMSLKGSIDMILKLSQ